MCNSQRVKTLSEQLPQYEAFAAEYERISGREYGEDAKVASILQACPSNMKQRLQLWVDDATTYESLKNKIHHLEALTTRWEALNSLTFLHEPVETSLHPMKVDYIGRRRARRAERKGKMPKARTQERRKEKENIKEREAGREQAKRQAGAKSTWEKSPWKKPEKGKSDKGGKGSKSGACHVCGKQGHYAKDCWKRVQQVEDQQNPAGASSSSTGQTGGGVGSTTTSSVKMVRALRCLI